MKNNLKILFISWLFLNSVTFAATEDDHSHDEGRKLGHPGPFSFQPPKNPEEFASMLEEAKKSAESKEYKDAQEAMKRYYEMYPRPGLF